MRWEYETKKVHPDYVNRFLDEYAEKGWKLVQAFPYDQWIWLFFERPVQQ